VTTALRLRGS
jgi:tetratricopeptide (TPR) repeat protein